MHRTGILLKLFAAAAVVMVVLLATATWFFFKRPLTLDAAFSRFALGQAGLTRHTLTTASGRLTFFEGGEGPPLILVHDAGDQAGSWARVVSPLLADYRVVVPDLAGHGSSDPRKGPITTERLVHDLERVVADRGLQGAMTVVGHGFGARVALQYIRDNPQDVARLVVVNGGPTAPENSVVSLAPGNRDEARTMMDGLMATAADTLPGHVLDDIVRHARTGPAARIDRSSRPTGGIDHLDETAVPAALIWGAHDELYDLPYASRLSERLGDAPVITLDACGHMPQRECPVEFVDALRSAILAAALRPTEKPCSGS